jgi:ABC-2 type transport system ATP-binding protein
LDEVRGPVADGVTVFLTTQYLEEADQLADRVAILDRGRIVAEDRPDTLKRRVGGTQVRLRLAAAADRDRAAGCIRASATTHDPFELRVPVGGGCRVGAPCWAGCPTISPWRIAPS